MTDHLNSPIFERLYNNISPFPYASEGKDERGVFGHARRYPKSIAVTKPYIQKNGQRLKIYLPFDIDRQNGGTAWMDANLPAPNFDIIDPRNGHAHLVYELVKPIWLKKNLMILVLVKHYLYIICRQYIKP